MRVELYSGAGNRFLLLEAGDTGLEPPELARELCARPLFEGLAADGLLLLRGDESGAPHMEIYNADGSRPEACGNGLRCMGWHLLRGTGRERARVQTDAGERTVELEQQEGARAQLFSDMGHVRVEALNEPWPRLRELLDARRVDVGNPHCVLRVEDERSPELERVGRELQTHRDYPRGVNVGFLARREQAWQLRVWERGVGETEACGTGACAAAAVIGPAAGVLEIHMRGGLLRVRSDAEGRYHLLGEARHHGTRELDELAPVASPREER